MSLNKSIRETIQLFRDNFPPELVSLIEQGAGEISALEIVEKALTVGDVAPAFSLLGRDGQSHTLAAYLAKGPVVLTFYRGVWCPYCNLQLAAYNQSLAGIEAAGGTLVAVTPERPDGFQALLDSNAPDEMKASMVDNVDFDVLYDDDSQLGEKYGLVFELPDAHKKLFEVMNLDVERATGSDSFTFSDPATYIIGVDGFIKWAFVPNNYRKRAEPGVIIEQLNNL